MNTERTQSLAIKRPRDRLLLPHLVESTEQCSRSHIGFYLILVMIPFVVLIAVEFGARVFDPPVQPLSKPWNAYGGPYPPLSEYMWTGEIGRAHV